MTFEFRLHGTWADYGGIEIQLATRIYEGDPDTVEYLYTGDVYRNCSSAANCSNFGDPQYDNWTGYFLPGDNPDNRSGSVDTVVQFVVDFQPGETRELFVQLMASSGSNGYGANVDAFNTVGLTRALLAPGASITASSGTPYPVTTVPEPMTAALMLAGIAGLALARWSRR